jgi:hypothetical protein
VLAKPGTTRAIDATRHDQNAIGSLSPSSSDNQAKGRSSDACHCTSSVVLPNPGGATTTPIGASEVASIPTSRGRDTIARRRLGERSLAWMRTVSIRTPLRSLQQRRETEIFARGDSIVEPRLPRAPGPAPSPSPSHGSGEFRPDPRAFCHASMGHLRDLGHRRPRRRHAGPGLTETWRMAGKRYNEGRVCLCDRALWKALAITDEASPFALRSTRNSSEDSNAARAPLIQRSPRFTNRPRRAAGATVA